MTTRARFVGWHVVAIELHLVNPVIANRHAFSRHGTAGLDEAKLGHSLRMQRHRPGRATRPRGSVTATNGGIMCTCAIRGPLRRRGTCTAPAPSGGPIALIRLVCTGRPVAIVPLIIWGPDTSSNR